MGSASRAGPDPERLHRLRYSKTTRFGSTLDGSRR